MASGSSGERTLSPGFHHKSLDHPTFGGGILEHTPGVSTIAPALRGKLFKHRQERLAIVRIDPVFDRHQHCSGPRSILDPVSNNRRRQWIEGVEQVSRGSNGSAT
jgi:hypothetical protein